MHWIIPAPIRLRDVASAGKVITSLFRSSEHSVNCLYGARQDSRRCLLRWTNPETMRSDWRQAPRKLSRVTMTTRPPIPPVLSWQRSAKPLRLSAVQTFEKFLWWTQLWDKWTCHVGDKWVDRRWTSRFLLEWCKITWTVLGITCHFSRELYWKTIKWFCSKWTVCVFFLIIYWTHMVKTKYNIYLEKTENKIYCTRTLQ